MFCCDFTPRVIPSEEATKWSRVLKYIALGHIVSCIFFFVCGIFGLTDLILAWIAFMGATTFESCTISFYIWFLVISLITTFAWLGTTIQFSVLRDPLYITLLSTVFVFYCFSLYVSYRAYKEFHALAIESLLPEGMKRK